MKQFKRIAGLLVLIATLGAFAHYVNGHPELWWQLQTTSPWLLLRLFFLYACTIAVLVFVYDTTLRICRQTIPLKEHSILTAYSAIVNFFGPLQSGPGFRSVYLKRKHNVSLQRYATVTLFYYAFFGSISGLFLLSGSPKLLAIAVIGSLVLLGTVGLYANYRWPRLRQRFMTPETVRLVIRLGIGTLMQVVLISLIYWSELRSVDASISFGQAIIYTGAANFALFVSLTPGALGFRESFLFFSRNLHHISSSTIVSANVIDRSVYVTFLGMLFLVTLAVHAKSRLGVKTINKE